MTKFSLNRANPGSLYNGTYHDLFDPEEEAEAKAAEFRKEEPDAEFWTERFSG